MNKGSIVIATVVFVIVGAVLWKTLLVNRNNAVANGFAAPPLAVAVVPVSTKSMTDTTEALGTLRANESVSITTTVTETVEQVIMQEGQRVNKGEVLVRLTQDEELAKLRAEQANLQEQRREVKRLTALVKKGSAPQTLLDERQTLLDTARHQVAEAQARLADRTLRAPFSGRLGLRQVSPGALLSPGTVITTLDDTRIMKLDFNLPGTLLNVIAPEQPITATTPALEQKFQGKVTVIDTRINPLSRSFAVRAEFDNSDEKLKPGMLMTVTLTSNPRQAIQIPEQALISRKDEHSVLVAVGEPSTVETRPVSIGSRRLGWVEITDGLDGGERVLIEGLNRVRPGQTVTVKESEQ